MGATTVELDTKGMEANQKFEAFTVLQDNTKVMNYEHALACKWDENVSGRDLRFHDRDA
jgi:hypothetical protein